MIIKNKTIYADLNKIVTNGVVYGEIVFLSNENKISEYYEIDYDEYLQKFFQENNF